MNTDKSHADTQTNIKQVSDVATEASNEIARAIQRAVTKKGFAVVALCGGRSASAVCEKLVSSKLPWDKIHFFIVDERRVPLTDSDSNFRLIRESLFEPAAVPTSNIHPFVGDEVEAYARELSALGGAFDVVFLSSGEDGHVAALYPNHPALFSERPFVLLDDSPKLPPRRMTSSRELLLRSEFIVLVFSGDKREAYARFCDKSLSTQVPAKLVLCVPHVVLVHLAK